MSKSKNKNKTEVEHLRGIIRQLKAQLKYYRKREHLNEKDTEEDETIEINANCPECGKGVLEEVDLHLIKLIRCPVCKYEKRERNKR